VIPLVSLLLVEDRYGVDFYSHVLGGIVKNIIIKRLMGARCNPKIERQIKALLFRYHIDKVAIIVDSENDRLEDVENDLENHVARIRRIHSSIRIFIVQPYHEKLLCLGLVGDYRKCSTDPISYIEYVINNKYQHKMLGTLVRKIDVRKILLDNTINDLINYLKDP